MVAAGHVCEVQDASISTLHVDEYEPPVRRHVVLWVRMVGAVPPVEHVRAQVLQVPEDTDAARTSSTETAAETLESMAQVGPKKPAAQAQRADPSTMTQVPRPLHGTKAQAASKSVKERDVVDVRAGQASPLPEAVPLDVRVRVYVDGIWVWSTFEVRVAEPHAFPEHDADETETVTESWRSLSRPDAV